MNGTPIRVTWLERKSDLIKVSENEHYICLMKLFPQCCYSDAIDHDDFRRFHIRCYLPRKIVTDAKHKIEKVVLMSNGLNEIDYYTLYDEIGAGLASLGTAAILVPLPDHLNRHTRFRFKRPSISQILKKPSEILMDEPIKLYTRYYQYRNELNVLIDHLRNRKCSDPSNPKCSFFYDLFSSNTRISLLGFSLGGTAMLVDFLASLENNRKINTCILLNGGVILSQTEPSKLFGSGKWEKFVMNLEDAYQDDIEDAYKENNINVDEEEKLNYGIFGSVVFGHKRQRIQNLLQKYGSKIMFIYGGRDTITGLKTLREIEPPNWGLTILTLPGINHFLPIDEEWNKWSYLINDIIYNFDESGTREGITRQDGNTIAELRSKDELEDSYKGLNIQEIELRLELIGQNPNRIAQERFERKEMKRFKRVQLIELLTKIESCHDLADEISDSERKILDEIKIGQLLRILDLIGTNQLVRALELQSNMNAKGKHKKLGLILSEDFNVITKEHIEVLMKPIEDVKEICTVPK